MSFTQEFAQGIYSSSYAFFFLFFVNYLFNVTFLWKPMGLVHEKGNVCNDFFHKLSLSCKTNFAVFQIRSLLHAAACWSFWFGF